MLTRDPIDDRWPYVVLDVGPVGSGFLLLAPSTDSNEGGGMLVGAPDGTLEPRAWPAFIEVDW